MHSVVHKKYRVMDRHVTGFRQNSLYVMHPLEACPLGFSKMPLRVRVSEFGMIANEFFSSRGATVS
jgi:hypothetical protein